MKRNTVLLATLAFALVLGMGITPAWGYFTDTHTANGGLKVVVKPTTDIYEWVKGNTKSVVITCAKDTAPVFVRARVYSSVPYEATGESWRLNGDWYEYNEILTPDSKTKPLNVEINFRAITSTENPPAVDDNYNVIVVYESTPVKYNVGGEAYADWNNILVDGSSEGGN